jgi:hypothetical protein
VWNPKITHPSIVFLRDRIIFALLEVGADVSLIARVNISTLDYWGLRQEKGLIFHSEDVHAYIFTFSLSKIATRHDGACGAACEFTIKLSQLTTHL